MKYIDTHMHVVPSEFDDYKEILQEAFEKGVHKMFVVGCEEKTIPETLEVAKEYDNIYPIIGIHPNDSTGVKDADFVRSHFTDDVIAIGEIGLDFHWEDNPSREIQIASLEAQLELAMEKGIPAVIHSRDANEETLKVIGQEKYKNLQIVMHSYAYGIESLQDYLDLGCYLSFSGIVTFKNAKDFKEAVKTIPLDRLLSETDSPYLAPVPHRGKRNQPAYVIDTIKYIAELREEKLEVVLEAIEKNVKDVFNV
ncbi:MAG: TatD family hydrolase [Mycoplasmatales bacterium]|nr:TatD family hydrolase [Mycoplasmatales bacterium]